MNNTTYLDSSIPFGGNLCDILSQTMHLSKWLSHWGWYVSKNGSESSFILQAFLVLNQSQQRGDFIDYFLKKKKTSICTETSISFRKRALILYISSAKFENVQDFLLAINYSWRQFLQERGMKTWPIGGRGGKRKTKGNVRNPKHL